MRFWRYIKGIINEQENSSNMSEENLPNIPSDNNHSGDFSGDAPENSSPSNQEESNANELETKSSDSNGNSEKGNSQESEENSSSSSQFSNPKDDSISELDSKSDEKVEDQDLEKSFNNDSNPDNDNSLSKCSSQDQSENNPMNDTTSQESPNSEDNDLNTSKEEESLEKTETNNFLNDNNSNPSTEHPEQDEVNEKDKESLQPSSSSSKPSENESGESQKGDEEISKMSDSGSEIQNDESIGNGASSPQDDIPEEASFLEKNDQTSKPVSSSSQNQVSNMPNEEKMLDGERSQQTAQDEQEMSQEDMNPPESENTSQDLEPTKEDEASKSESKKSTEELDNSSANNFEQNSDMESNQPHEQEMSQEDINLPESENTSQDLESTKEDEVPKLESKKSTEELDNSNANNIEQNSDIESNQTASSEQNEKKASESLKSQEESNFQERTEETADEQPTIDSEKSTPEKMDISKHVNHPSLKDELADNEEDEDYEEEQKSTTPEKTEAQHRKELLHRFKETIEQARDNLIQEEIKKYQLNQEKEELGDNANQFLGSLDKLLPFDQRDKAYGYSIDTESTTDVDEIIIKNLINKFLNQRFCSHKEDLNVRSNSLEKSRGFLKWEVKDVIVHLETEQLTKVLNDKYGYNYSQGKNEFVPLSFYFDLSGSMSNFTNMLATVAIELLKKDVKVLIGNNERVEVQIDSLDKSISVEELAEFLDDLGICNRKIKYKRISQNIDNYLINHKAEKVCVFADFDPLKSICNLSHYAQVYWFCFEKAYKMEHVFNFDGFIYPVKDLDTIAEGLKKVNAQRFKALVYTENPKQLRKVLK